jgi:hypothetical protein
MNPKLPLSPLSPVSSLLSPLSSLLSPLSSLLSPLCSLLSPPSKCSSILTSCFTDAPAQQCQTNAYDAQALIPYREDYKKHILTPTHTQTHAAQLVIIMCLSSITLRVMMRCAESNTSTSASTSASASVSNFTSASTSARASSH